MVNLILVLPVTLVWIIKSRRVRPQSTITDCLDYLAGSVYLKNASCEDIVKVNRRFACNRQILRSQGRRNRPKHHSIMFRLNDILINSRQYGYTLLRRTEVLASLPFLIREVSIPRDIHIRHRGSIDTARNFRVRTKYDPDRTCCLIYGRNSEIRCNESG